MRRPTARNFPNRVTLVTCTVQAGQRGGASDQTRSAGTAFAASVQPAGARRVQIHAATGSTTTHTVYFRDPPLDASEGARARSATQRLGPEVNVRDLIVWRVDPADATKDRTLAALGPANDEGGRGVLWSVDCLEQR